MKTQNERIQIVISNDLKSLIDKAAEKKRLSRSAFMRIASLIAAQAVLSSGGLDDKIAN
jgi:uncharacterized protein (DUF1778 family)